MLPTTESQARILAAQDRDLQPIIWGKAVENAGGIPTAKIVEKIAKEVVDEMKTSKSSSQTENECCHGTETICQKRFFAPGDVVRIISKNQWGIVKQIKEFSAIVMTTLGENKAQLVDLMPVEEIATASDRVMAKELMLRLQKAAAALVGKDEAIAVKWIQDVARKDVPKLSDLEEEFLVAIENIIIGGQKQSSLAVNANLILDGFVNNLEYLGTEQIKSFMGAIATRKKEAITEAAIGLADDEDKAIEVIRAIARKYPNAIRQAIEEF